SGSSLAVELSSVAEQIERRDWQLRYFAVGRSHRHEKIDGSAIAMAFVWIKTTTRCPATFAVDEPQVGVRLGQLRVGVAHDIPYAAVDVSASEGKAEHAVGAIVFSGVC